MRKKLIICIPTENEANTIRHVVKIIDQGIGYYYPDWEALIVNADNDSDDETQDLFLSTPTKTAKHHITTFSKGKGENIVAFLQYALPLKPEAIAFFDGDLLNLDPSWVKNLIHPIAAGNADVVFPGYSTSQGGPLRNLLSYPAILGLFGLDVEQPTGGELGLGPVFCDYLSTLDWTKAPRGYGIDFFMASHAAISGVRSVTSVLGQKIHTAKPWHSIGHIVMEVVECILSQSALHTTGRRLGAADIQTRSSAADCSDDEAAAPLKAPIDIEALKSVLTDRLNGSAASNDELPEFVLDSILHVDEDVGVTDDVWVRSLSSLVHAARYKPDSIRLFADVATTLFFARMLIYAGEIVSMDEKTIRVESRLRGLRLSENVHFHS